MKNNLPPCDVPDCSDDASFRVEVLGLPRVLCSYHYRKLAMEQRAGSPLVDDADDPRPPLAPRLGITIHGGGQLWLDPEFAKAVGAEIKKVRAELKDGGYLAPRIFPEGRMRLEGRSPLHALYKNMRRHGIPGLRRKSAEPKASEPSEVPDSLEAWCRDE